MRVLACGGRDYDDEACVWRELDAVHRATPVDVLIEGGARGADLLARGWAVHRGVLVAEFRAEWVRYGASAGPVRNRRMLREGRPDLVLAFPGGRGTDDMCRAAEEAMVPVRRVPTVELWE